MTHADKKPQKKSETLEVRISYETKQKLANRAETESRTVSEIVRRLIDSYLTLPASSTETSTSGDAVMRLKHFFLEKPKTILAGSAALIASLLFVIPAASADPFMLDMQGEYTQFGVEGPDSKRIRRFETQIELDFGSTIVMDIGGQSVSLNPILVEDGVWLKVKFDEVEIAKGEKAVSIILSIIDKANETETVVAQPTLTAAFDETATFMTETEREKYSFTFAPRNKS